MRIYLDMCSLQRPSDDRTQLRIRIESEAVLGVLAACAAGLTELLSSVALRYEMDRNPNPVRRAFTEEALSLAGEYIESTPAIAGRARSYVGRGIKPLDAMHLACAVAAGADYFCTCDDRLLKRARVVDTLRTKPVSPLELMEVFADEKH